MTNEEYFWRRAIVSASGILYWVGVLILARRVRKQIGRSPNLKPRGTKEKILWTGWMLVVQFMLLLYRAQTFTLEDSSQSPEE